MIYHPLSWGFILGEVIRRVTGMRFETYFDQNLAQPLGLQNSWFRLPSQRLKDSPKIISGHSDQNALAMLFNFRPIRRSVLPAGSLHSTAREMAVFYQMLINGGSYGGSKILKPETVSQAVSSGYRGWDEHFQRDSLWAYGFHLGGWKSSGSGGAVESVFGGRSTSSTFGHTGNRSTLAWGDTTHNLVMTFTCNRLLGSQEARQRWIDLSNAVWDLISV